MSPIILPIAIIVAGFVILIMALATFSEKKG